MTGWPAVGFVALGVVVFFRTVFTLDRWISLREWERRERKRLTGHKGSGLEVGAVVWRRLPRRR